ncbi:MAG: PIN domain-containing protein [Candidatus Pacearchaeota archaeon]
MGKQRYFFDTYAFFEILRGNPNYDKYINSVIVTTIFNIAELNYNLKKQKDKKIADSITEKYKDFIANVKIDDIKKAMDIKIKNKDLSIPDVVGYAVAKRHKVKFLTGDEGFRNFENVEFIK